MSTPFTRIGLRGQLALPFTLLLFFPIFGYLGIFNWTATLEQNQQTDLTRAAQSITKMLAANPSLLKEIRTVENLAPNRDLYVHKMTSMIQLDGKKNDWSQVESTQYRKNHLVEINLPYSSDSLSFDLKLSADTEFLYGFYEIRDDSIIYREINNLSVHRNDHIQIGLTDPDGSYHRYTIATFQPSQVTAHIISNSGRSIRKEDRIQGSWLATEQGYNVEIKIPLTLIGDQFATGVADVDDPESREIKYVMASAFTGSANELGALAIPPVLLEEFLASLPYSRISLIDKHDRVIAFSSHKARAKPLSPASSSYLTSDSDHRFISGDSGISYQGTDIGRIIVEETNDQILTFYDQAVQKLLIRSGLIFALGLLCWYLLSSIVTNRLRRLKQHLESAVDTKGRILHSLPVADASDEISDLSRSLSGIVDRLKQYNQHLEAMASRLAHELRTPVSVVRSSLENLNKDEISDDQIIYVKRANKGVERLNTILNKMSEATRLEESLDEEEIDTFDLVKVVEGCVNGYEIAYPDNNFLLSIEADMVRLTGIADLIAQMLDKLISNAVEFSPAENPIRIRLNVEDHDALLRVLNDGPSLPVMSESNLFDSMVSLRKERTMETSHLGLGLYIARIITEFHGGTINATDREDGQGVIITVRIPLMRLSARLRP